ncbi:MAG: GntR family transcriptional regulator [Burkholderiaceae bacterium]
MADEVYEQIKADLNSFVLVPGDRFSELELCERLGVSRTPVRQALFRLQQEGQVEVLFRNGWRVLPFDFHRFDQLYDLRILLETDAVQRLCDGRISGDAQRSAELLKGLQVIWLAAKARRVQDAEVVAGLDEDFHSTLVEATGNVEMLRVHRDISERIRVIRRLDFTQRQRIEATYDEHGKILRAVLSGRADTVRMLLRSHVESSQIEVRKITLHQLQMARSDQLTRR